MKKLPLVKDYMATPVVWVKPEMCIYKAIDILINRNISGAPVVDNHGKLIGLISEKDCFRLVSKGFNHTLPKEQELTVSDFMTRDVETISPDVNVYYAAGVFLKVPYRRMPVIKDNRVVGVLSRVDVLRGIRDYLATSPQPSSKERA